jgi:cytochrome b
MKRLPVWDPPLRIFHWSLAILVTAAMITANIGGNAMDWHGRLGVAIIGLLAFRLAWGFLGSTHARFIDFLPRPATLRAYLRGDWHGLGHNPLGALSVLAMLLTLSFQATLGLFGNDDIAFTGPLQPLVSKEASDALTGLHHRGAWLIGTLIALHLGAIAYYRLARREDLVTPMLTGQKTVPDDVVDRPVRGGGWGALLAALTLAGGVAWFAAGAWLPEPPPPIVTDTPAW